jgi:hypothetical protein
MESQLGLYLTYEIDGLPVRKIVEPTVDTVITNIRLMLSDFQQKLPIAVSPVTKLNHKAHVVEIGCIHDGNIRPDSTPSGL